MSGWFLKVKCAGNGHTITLITLWQPTPFNRVFGCTKCTMDLCTSSTRTGFLLVLQLNVNLLNNPSVLIQSVIRRGGEELCSRYVIFEYTHTNTLC